MASFTIGNATYARSKSGITSLKNNLVGDLTTISNNLKTTNPKYTTLKNTIQKHWVGADADAFLKKLEADLNELSKDIAAYQIKITTALDAALNDFLKEQNQIAGRI